VLHYRSLLFVPAHREGWALKAARTGTDALILDLEDAVPPAAKEHARQALAAQVSEAKQEVPGIGIVVRINEWGTAEADLDVAALAKVGVDAVMVPKLDEPRTAQDLGAVLAYVARSEGRRVPGIIGILESARAIVNASALAAVDGVHGLAIGAAADGDTARSVGYRWTATGVETLTMRSNTVLACRSVAGCVPYVGLWQDIEDLEGLRSFAMSNRELGFLGQTLIHPSHVAVVNAAFSLTSAEVDFYSGLIDAYQKAAESGVGAVVYRGQHIDLAHVTRARELLRARV